MDPATFSALLLPLAAIGCAGVLLRLGSAMLRLGLRAAEGTTASGLAELSERRGDITGFMERRRAAARIRRSRRRAGFSALGWLVVLVAPPLAGAALHAYAAASLVWLFPRSR